MHKHPGCVHVRKKNLNGLVSSDIDLFSSVWVVLCFMSFHSQITISVTSFLVVQLSEESETHHSRKWNIWKLAPIQTIWAVGEFTLMIN